MKPVQISVIKMSDPGPTSTAPQECDRLRRSTWLLKECPSVLTPTITNIVNLSVTSGQFHPILKESVNLAHFSRNLL